MLWSKPLANGEIFELSDNKKGVYLYRFVLISHHFAKMQPERGTTAIGTKGLL
jgi:hypothetical protein